MRTFGITLLLTTLLTSLPAAPAAADDFETLVEWMTGSFSSAAHAAADTNFYDIRLEMARIWPERTDGAWLYVEQAAAWALEKPYRQRVYHVQDGGDGDYTSKVYALPDPVAAIGAWKDVALLGGLGPEDLVERAGCTVYLERTPDGSFHGGTRDRDCTSQLRGATWASSIIEMRADRIVSWDQGWNDAGEQVWGAEKGGYEFLRVER